MSDKVKKTDGKPQPEQGAEETLAPEISPEGNDTGMELEEVKAEMTALAQQLEEALAKSAENLDGWQRAQAEFINYKKRLERDRDLEQAFMKGEVIKKVLPVLDDLERALANRPQEESWSGGIELIARKFQSILESEGLQRIDAQGQPFDPNFHEAISNEPSDEVESGHVIEVVQNGYLLGERVVRPAVVRVAQ